VSISLDAYRDRFAAELPRRLRGLPKSRLVAEDGPHPTVKVGANGATVYKVVLAGRATSVPFTAV
jgi:hypothetical protein